ncbi:MAG: hypothetical protein ACOY82_03655 [Pseudomonadota bacterium]
MRRAWSRLAKRWSDWRPRLFGIEVGIHHTAWILVGIIALSTLKTPLVGLAAIASYLGLVLLHEFGHAYFSRRLGYEVFGIEVGAFHGTCWHETHGDERDEAIIAWGGVAAQLALALPLIALDLVFALRGEPVLGGMVKILGYGSVVLAAVNLIPVAPLDGARAWRLPRILWHERGRQRPRKPRAPKRNLPPKGADGNVVKGPWDPRS